MTGGMSEGNIFTVQTARAALTAVLEAMEESENAEKLKEARETAGNDMIKRMQFVFPLVMMIQMDVIKQYGFTEGRNGMIQFTQLVRSLEREDSEVAMLHNQVRAHFLPEVPASTGASL